LRPAATVKLLNVEAKQVLTLAELTAAVLNEGTEATSLTRIEFTNVIATDIPRWQKVAKRQNIVAN
jgi:tripartite-type tricarboxylate transporter receptor subunit TctC